MLKLFLMPVPSFEYSITRLLSISMATASFSHWCLVLHSHSLFQSSVKKRDRRRTLKFHPLPELLWILAQKYFQDTSERVRHFHVSILPLCHHSERSVSLSHTLYRYSGCETFVLVLEGSRETFTSQALIHVQSSVAILRPVHGKKKCILQC